MTNAANAHPQYAPGDTIIYRDQHNREQVGAVIDIEARWHRARHPTYRNRYAYVPERNVMGTCP